MHRLNAILEALPLGVVTLDPGLRVESWNRWMEIHSGVKADRIVGDALFDHFPSLDTPRFSRSCRSVLRLGNYAYFSQKLHRFLFPFAPPSALDAPFDRMQQSCVMGPIREADGTIGALFLIVQDVTELAAQERALVELNIRDPLTGVFNRRHLDQRLEAELERYRRYGRPLSVLLLDVDHFKGVNDRHGHACGDVVLKGLAAGMVESLRSSDMVARYGGEEFCCVLPETGRAGALATAEKLRCWARTHPHPWDGQELTVTVSLGVAEAAPGDTGAALLRRADAGLYRAKRAGRDRVEALD